MTYLVIGATGAQGAAVARRLVAEGRRVRGFARSATMPPGVEPVHGDLSDAAAVRAAFAGARRAFVSLPPVYYSTVVSHYVATIREAALAAGVDRLVFNVGTRLPARESGLAVFETRRRAIRTLRDAGLPVLALCPTLYLDDLAAPAVSGPLAEEGVLRCPLPADLPVAWMSHDDLGAAAHAALVREDVPLHGSARVGGPSAVTGDELAAAFGARYEPLDPMDFEAELAGALGIGAASAVVSAYEWAAVDRTLYAAAHDLPGVRPAALRSWIAAQPWADLSPACRR
ncbi:SDR family oxidoreductase [Nonomuraea longicatena]|uniref:NmrA family NAD(P)-binding protein n=1 Tax=Nonomuraea longicatena TaxID=83682 RepID=A0ABP4AE22_9ACTN